MLKVNGRLFGMVGIAALSMIAGVQFVGAVETAGQLPPQVAKAVSELVYACRAAGGPLVQPSAYIHAADIDGDRITDYVVDPSKGCEANKKARCTADGCAIDVYLSSRASSGAVALRGSQSSIEVASGQATVKLVRASPECQGAAAPANCREALRYVNGSLGKVQP